MVQYRTFRNTDPPRLVDVWNETFDGRAAVRLGSSTPLERFVFSRPFFDPAGLFIAEEGECLGFGHAALVPGAGGGPAEGVVCALGVRPAHRRRGIGAHLLGLCEEYLRGRGAGSIRAGSVGGTNPFYLGLYGGCDASGFLRSEPLAEPFFVRHGYAVERRALVMQRPLDQPFKLFDPRFVTLRQRFDLRVAYPRSLHGWWREATLGYVDPLECLLIDRQTELPAARTLIWDMEGFSERWCSAAVGIVAFDVEDEYRRQGIGKLFLSYLMRQVQEQFFQVVEVHLQETNAIALRFLRSLAFEHVDTGQGFLKQGS